MQNKMNPTAMTAPIPGMGLTSKLGSRPWQRPPEMQTFEEAANFYIGAIANRKFITVMLDAMEAGAPVTALVDTLIKGAVMEGKHTIDVGVLVAPIVTEAFITLADKAGIDYTSGLEEEDEGPSKLQMRTAIKKIFESDNATEEQVDMREEMQSATESAAKGLMAKRG